MTGFINNNPGVCAVLSVFICFALLTYILTRRLEKGDRRTVFLMRRLDKKLSVTEAGLTGRVNAMNDAMSGAAANLTAVSDSMEARQERMRREINDRLDALGSRLGQDMQQALETRLGESFNLVNTQLESVYRGLGEMRTLAQGVGDLKKVLSGVKTRGIWGEVRLKSLLSDTLPEGAYLENTSVRPGASERVEFALRLPAGDSDTDMLLAIDSKFPMEAYSRLAEAQESGDAAEIKKSTKAFEDAVLTEGKRISSKYICPPDTVDFAIMFLPTESLFMQLLSSGELTDRLQRELHIMPAGPTSLASLLNCLQLGFRSRAVEKRSYEILRTLENVRREFDEFGAIIDKARTRLEQAAGELDSVGTRSRALKSQLRDAALPEKEEP